MASTAGYPLDQRGRAAPSRRRESMISRARTGAKPALNFWSKVSNDWVFNLSGMLAYNILMSLFPILLVLLAVAGFILGALAPAQADALRGQLSGALPGGSQLIGAIYRQLSDSAGVLLVVGIVTAAFTGSRLFIAIENCLAVVFRLRTRDFLHQNLMAFGMLLIYAVLFPVLSLSTMVPAAIVGLAGPLQGSGLAHFLIWLAGIGLSVVVAFVFFGVIYVVVPARQVRWGEVWKGTLVAAALLVLYNLLFPLYESLFLHPRNYGSLAGFAIVILVYLYYVGFILLIGAEVNSWAVGQRQTDGDIPALLHEMQAHGTTRGVAGPTAGMPREDLQGGKGAAAKATTEAAIEHARTDHRANTRPSEAADARGDAHDDPRGEAIRDARGDAGPAAAPRATA